MSGVEIQYIVVLVRTLTCDIPTLFKRLHLHLVTTLSKCTEFSSHKFLCADDIIYVVAENVNFRFQFAVRNMLDFILSKLKLLIRLNEVE